MNAPDDRALDVAEAGEDDDVPGEVERLHADRRVRREHEQQRRAGEGRERRSSARA